MNSKKYTCPRCGSEDELLITSPKKESPKKYIIGFIISSVITSTTLPFFFKHLLEKTITFLSGSFWAALVLYGIPLFLSIFFFAKWLNFKNDDSIEECVCKKCGEIWLEVPPIHHTPIENNQND